MREKLKKNDVELMVAVRFSVLEEALKRNEEELKLSNGSTTKSVGGVPISNGRSLGGGGREATKIRAGGVFPTRSRRKVGILELANLCSK